MEIKTQLSRSRKVLLGLVLFAVVTVVCGSIAEVGLRLWITYNPGYYTAFTGQSARTLRYPYGVIHLNKLGYPDADFIVPKDKPRIAYVGDSVCFGVGAGHGYRITEVLDRLVPQYEHMNFGRVEAGIDKGSTEYLLKDIDRFNVDAVVYLMNLNDILPTAINGLTHSRGTQLLGELKGRLDSALRGRSYLYTQLRFALAKTLMRFGIGHDGTAATEFFPNAEVKSFQDTAARINEFAAALAERGKPLTVVVLPYEMQISQSAAETYAQHGIRWGRTFIDRGPQRLITELLDENITVIDAYYAFISPGQVQQSRQQNKLGQFFVYNRGDRLDWNHPNRVGHRQIAEYIFESGKLPQPANEATAAAARAASTSALAGDSSTLRPARD